MRDFAWEELVVKYDDIGEHGYQLDTVLSKAWLMDALGERKEDIYHATDTPSRAALFLFKEAGGVRVKGKLEFTVWFECGWCLKRLEKHMVLDLDTLFLPAERFVEPGKTLRETEEDMEVFLFEEGELYLHRFLSEEILLALPAYPTVDRDNGGRCLICGKTLAEIIGNGKKRKPVIDERWAKLKELKLKLG